MAIVSGAPTTRVKKNWKGKSLGSEYLQDHNRITNRLAAFVSFIWNSLWSGQYISSGQISRPRSYWIVSELLQISHYVLSARGIKRTNNERGKSVNDRFIFKKNYQLQNGSLLCLYTQIQDKLGYYILTSIKGNIITFHLTPEGHSKILKAGVTPERPFWKGTLVRSLSPLVRFLTYGSGPGEVIVSVDECQTELDFSNDPDSEK